MTQSAEMPTLDQVLDLVKRLPLADQARLVEQVLPRLTDALSAESNQPSVETSRADAFSELIRIGESLARDWPATARSADVLSAMRDER